MECSRRAFLASLLSLPLVGTASQPPRRKVYLRRLERLVRDRLQAQRAIEPRARFLGGLYAIERVYVIDDDIVLEGPAADRWNVHFGHTALAAPQQRPLLCLDDLVVALRNVYSDSPPPMLSLEARREALRAVRQVLQRFGVPKGPKQAEELQRQIQQVWGQQDAVLEGVPRRTRFALVMTYADWEMKRLSLGLRKVDGVPLPVYADLEFEDYRAAVLRRGPEARPAVGGSRFWFMATDEPFGKSPDNRAFSFPKQPVKLVTEGYFRSRTFARVSAPPTAAAQRFAEAFTELYAQIADKIPVFHDLQNLFHLVGFAKLLKRFDLPRQIDWDLSFWLETYPVQPVNTPATMPGLAVVKHGEVELRGRGLRARLFLPAWGGVYIDPPVYQ